MLTGTTTGISAHDRALTARKLADPLAQKDDFTKPGHLVPLKAKAGGVLQRRGHTEASVGQSRPALRLLSHEVQGKAGSLC